MSVPSVKLTSKVLEEEIKTTNRKDVVESYEGILNEIIDDLIKNENVEALYEGILIENFFNLPLNHIISIISKLNFSEIEEINFTKFKPRNNFIFII